MIKLVIFWAGLNIMLVIVTCKYHRGANISFISTHLALDSLTHLTLGTVSNIGLLPIKAWTAIHLSQIKNRAYIRAYTVSIFGTLSLCTKPFPVFLEQV